ncbi:MAG: hypothetical protein A2W05_09065 [Candidatus Schekmanbacteria bacterium RBG_16_38_10]|uniref:Ketosynthase family 3 (KS3) domain-containing protein n=1 Tax=Candidatus Schekmanbacteria bacterium RBG_16_38_10 TaxID=1817879 RepID=A0A1F7S073_9BACT|nr:MAG: hypothetical protein A2W05_09065 [Candidatus Schekmanbacteria bacterium RBG_16_38_10]
MNALNVVITGIGAVTPLKPFKGMDTFWNALCSGEDAVKKEKPPLLGIDMEWPMAKIDLSGFSNSTNPVDKLQIIAEEALRMATEDAELHNHSNIGLSIGTILGNVLVKENEMMLGQKPSAGSSLSNITSHLSGKFNLQGPEITVSTACASGTDAIGIAMRKIMAEGIPIMIAGGVEVLSNFALTGFHALKVLTEEKVRPFDKSRSGIALGEGAAFVVLESEEHAVQRKAKIYGRVLGYTSRVDANNLTAPDREGRGLADAINQSILQANLKPHDIDYINAHGTGTLYNDLMETKAIKKIFGKSAHDVPISSTKSMLGHSLGAAGVIEAICCLLSIKNKIIPPTINFREKDPECDLDYVPNIARFHKVKTAMSFSAGFGGQNSAVILGKI